MKLHFAGAESSLKILHSLGAKRLLITMATGKNKIKQVPFIFEEYDLIVDSGAFTYFNKGGISVDDWIAEADKIKHIGNELICLDVIGDASRTFDNYKIIKQSFPDCIPTYHVGTDIAYLKKYLNTTDRVAIGGLVHLGVNTKKAMYELNKVFSLVDKNNVPKFHAFGIFNQKTLKKYPFYSADATSWMNPVRYGKTFVNNEKNKRVLLNKVITDKEKIMYEINHFQNLEKHLTELWEKRGVVWNE